MRILLYLASLLIVLLSGCGVNKDVMFKTPTDYEYATIPDSARNVTYRLSIDDLIEFRLFTNEGYQLIDVGTMNQQGNNQNLALRRSQVLYRVDNDGTVKLPTIGRIELEGQTIREAETMLEELYSEYYRQPFVILNVRNNRVIVSPGGGGTAKVVTIENKNTTVLEVLAAAGGIAERGNAEEVKLIRRMDDGSRKIYDLDLSTIEGIEDADITVQANDIVYVEPMPRVANEVARNLSPYISLLNTAVLVIGLLNLR